MNKRLFYQTYSIIDASHRITEGNAALVAKGRVSTVLLFSRTLLINVCGHKKIKSDSLRIIKVDGASRKGILKALNRYKRSWKGFYSFRSPHSVTSLFVLFRSLLSITSLSTSIHFVFSSPYYNIFKRCWPLWAALLPVFVKVSSFVHVGGVRPTTWTQLLLLSHRRYVIDVVVFSTMTSSPFTRDSYRHLSKRWIRPGTDPQRMDQQIGRHFTSIPWSSLERWSPGHYVYFLLIFRIPPFSGSFYIFLVLNFLFPNSAMKCACCTGAINCRRV